MGIEIERKFLVNVQGFLAAEPALKVVEKAELHQGYLTKEPCVRVRIQDDSRAWLTIKGPGSLERSEWEYPIPVLDAKEMYNQLCQNRLSKIRRRVQYEGHTWDVDEFLYVLKGLWLAEIELASAEEPFSKPPWLFEEVTGRHHYSNAWLAEHGLPGLCGDPALDSLLLDAKAAYEAMTPEQQQAHRREQVISWVWGEAKIRCRSISRPEVEQIADRMIADGTFKL